MSFLLDATVSDNDTDTVIHFLPPGVAYTTGLSHNPFTWLLSKTGRK